MNKFEKTREEMYQGLMKLIRQRKVGRKGLIRCIEKWLMGKKNCPWWPYRHGSKICYTLMPRTNHCRTCPCNIYSGFKLISLGKYLLKRLKEEG